MIIGERYRIFGQTADGATVCEGIATLVNQVSNNEWVVMFDGCKGRYHRDINPAERVENCNGP